jgi:hypothetical protein
VAQLLEDAERDSGPALPGTRGASPGRPRQDSSRDKFLRVRLSGTLLGRRMRSEFVIGVGGKDGEEIEASEGGGSGVERVMLNGAVFTGRCWVLGSGIKEE